MTSTLVVDGGAPLVGDIEVRGAKNLVSKAMVAVVLAEEPCRLRGRARDLRRPGRQRPARAARRAHRLHRPRRRARARPDQRRAGAHRRHRHPRRVLAGCRSCSAGRCCTGSARRSSPTSVAAASASARSTTTSTCCASSAPSSRSARTACGSPRPNGLHGADVDLPYPSVGATEQVLLTAVRARGITTLRNAAIEPEIMDLIAILQKMGAIISVQTDRVITIEGVDRLGGLRPPRHPRPDRGRRRGPAPRWPPTATSTCAARSSCR